MRHLSRDRIFAIVILILGLIWGYITLNLPKYDMEGVPGPSFFPIVILVSFMFLAVLLLFRKPKQGEEEKKGPILSFRQIVVFTIIFLYVATIPYLGFLIGTCIFLFLLLLYNGKLKIISMIITSVLTSGLLFLIFRIFLKISLPAGIILG